MSQQLKTSDVEISISQVSTHNTTPEHCMSMSQLVVCRLGSKPIARLMKMAIWRWDETILGHEVGPDEAPVPVFKHGMCLPPVHISVFGYTLAMYWQPRGAQSC